MQYELLKILLILGVGSGLAFSLLLLVQTKCRRSANTILASFIIITIIPLWNDYLKLSPSDMSALEINIKFYYLPFLYGPLLYLYTNTITKGPQLSSKTRWLLAAGPILNPLFLLFHYQFLEEGFSQSSWYLFYLVINLQIAACLLASARRLVQYSNDIEQNFSNTEDIKLNWLKRLLIAYLILVVIYFVQSTIKLAGLPYLRELQVVVACYESVFICFIGYSGLTQPQLHIDNIVVNEGAKYEKSSLSNDAAQELISMLNSAMTEEELYLDNELSLSTLATHIGVNPHHLSQAINQQMNQNFYDMVNSLRVDKAKIMLADSNFRKLPIIDIAYQVGFNNKTSFNSAFKKLTAQTPSQFRAKAA